MNRLTTLALLLAVAALGFFVHRQMKFEVEHPPEVTEPLFKGVDPAFVRAFRIENLERSNHIRLERTATGVWYITDPIAYPAEPAVIEQLLKIVSINLAGPVPSALNDPEAADLVPGRAFLEVEEVLDGGAGSDAGPIVRKTRVVLGAVDLDGQRVFVSRDGKVMRTARNFESILQRDLPDLRSRRLFRVDPQGVTEIVRAGRVFLPDSSPSAAMEVRAEGAQWRFAVPRRALADGDIMNMYARELATIAVERFVTDQPGADLAQYGLAPAWFSVLLRDRSGAEMTLEVGCDAAMNPYARYPGEPYVFQLSSRGWNLLIEGIDNFSELLEYEFYRVLRDHLQDVQVMKDGHITRLTRGLDGSWTVSERVVGETEFRLELPAEQAAVDDFLSKIENTKPATYLLDADVAELFPEGEPRDGIFLTPIRDRRQGGWIGPRYRTEGDTGVITFLREGEDVVAGLDFTVLELLAVQVSDFLKRVVWEVREVEMRRLVIRSGEKQRVYVRGDAFTWRPEDADIPARELRTLLDGLIFLKADGEVRHDSRAPLNNPVQIEFTDVSGHVMRAEIGLGVTGEVELTHGVRWARALDQELHQKLLALLDS